MFHTLSNQLRWDFFGNCDYINVPWHQQNLKNDKVWNAGLFGQEQRRQEIDTPYDRLSEAYISLRALMVRKDTSSYSEKIRFLNNYFSFFVSQQTNLSCIYELNV